MAVLISDIFMEWKQECEQRFNTLKSDEEELNDCFIKAYGLENELTSEVDEKDITIRKADLQRDIKSLISYAVGCIFGRYSVDSEGLCYAGGSWKQELYSTIVPVSDNVMTVGLDVFEINLTSRVIDFVEKVYGIETLEENLSFIAYALGGIGEPREILEKYLSSSFFADHCKVYHKKPIYWLFNSGRKSGFKAFVYIHRWNTQTLNEVMKQIGVLLNHYQKVNDEFQAKIHVSRPDERIKLTRELAKYTAKYCELQEYFERVAVHVKNEPDFDLDDGVKSNYQIYADILEKIK